MANLQAFFSDLLENKKNYLGAQTGDQFQDRIRRGLDGCGFNRILKDDLSEEQYAAMKKTAKSHFHDSDLHNPSPDYKSHYIEQPFGTQEYPDLVVLDGTRLACIEIKFSTREAVRPMWNGGLPRQNGIYLFGSRGKADLTYFRGGDLLTEEEAKSMHDFFDSMRKHQLRFNQELAGQIYGLCVYVRKAFEQSCKYNPSAKTNFFDNPARQELEKAVQEFAGQR